MLVPLVRLEVLFAVRLETWRAMLNALGAPPGLDAPQTHVAIGCALDPPRPEEGRELPRRLRAGLTTLNALASPRGREGLYDAADALSLTTSDWEHAASDAELVAQLLVRSARDPAIGELLDLACVDLRQTTRPEPFRVFQGPHGASGGASGGASLRASGGAPRALAWPPSNQELASLAAALDHDVARAFTSVESPGRLGIELFRVPAPASGEPRGAGQRPPRGSRRGAATDLAIVDPARDWLFLRPSHPRLLPAVRRAIGRLLHGDEEHYASSDVTNLAVLLDRGRDALHVPALAATISLARLIRVVWDKGERGIFTIDAADVFDELAKAGDPFARGRVRAATIRLTLAAREPRAVDVHLHEPNRIHIEPYAHDPIVGAFLDASGLVGGARPPQDLWSLAPWVHPRATWIVCVGEPAFTRMVAEGSLARTQSRAVAHPDHPHAGRALIAFPRPDGSHYGVSEDDDVPSRLLDESALETWRLDLLALGDRFARALGLEGGARAVARVEGLVALGRRALGPVDVRVLLAAARPAEGALADVVAALPGRARPALLVPRGRSLASGVAPAPLVGFDLTVELTALAASLLRDVVVALGLEDEVEALAIAPPGARVVVDEARELAWLDGTELDLTATDRALLTALASAGGTSVSYAVLARKVGAGPRDGSALPKQKHHLMAQMRESFARAGVALPADFDELIESASGKHGYRLTVRSFVR